MNLLKTAIFGAIIAATSMVADAQQDARVRVINKSSYSVWYIYTSPAGSKWYGNTDLLSAQKPNGRSVISSGDSAIIDFNVDDAANKCLQDVRAETKDGRYWEKTFNVCKESAWTLND